MEFIYDRKQEDVDRVIELNKKYVDGSITEDEKAEWASNMKGAFNLSDLTRIEGNIKALADFFKVSIGVDPYPEKTTRFIPRNRDYKRILDDLKLLRDAWFALSDTPAIPDQPLNTYQKWNDIEKNLHDLNYTYEGYINGFNYCDTEIYAGEGFGDL